MDLAGLIWYLLIGLVAGWLAGQIMKGGYGLVGDLIVGVLGAIIGGALFPMFGLMPSGTIGSVITATVGAILLIALLRFLKKP